MWKVWLYEISWKLLHQLLMIIIISLNVGSQIRLWISQFLCRSYILFLSMWLDVLTSWLPISSIDHWISLILSSSCISIDLPSSRVFYTFYLNWEWWNRCLHEIVWNDNVQESERMIELILPDNNEWVLTRDLIWSTPINLVTRLNYSNLVWIHHLDSCTIIEKKYVFFDFF